MDMSRGDNHGDGTMTMMQMSFVPTCSKLVGKTSGPGSVMARVAGQALVYGIKIGMAYLVMLSVMSFNNGGVFIAAVLGHSWILHCQSSSYHHCQPRSGQHLRQWL
ncbi:hypothetical protein MLD38_029847 [Melastoma candidum]|uniref:Uncharacterized protein n=1 Tax=Melastoma candidum TaxID=119954 RepID=A0ACB9N5D1_9MYRT|nr:hypothetical protein MLD38_029847 [Melastoma candidum]